MARADCFFRASKTSCTFGRSSARYCLETALAGQFYQRHQILQMFGCTNASILLELLRLFSRSRPHRVPRITATSNKRNACRQPDNLRQSAIIFGGNARFESALISPIVGRGLDNQRSEDVFDWNSNKLIKGSEVLLEVVAVELLLVSLAVVASDDRALCFWPALLVFEVELFRLDVSRHAQRRSWCLRASSLR